MSLTESHIELTPQELDELRLQADTERILRGECVATGDSCLAHADEYVSHGRMTPRHYTR